MYRIGGRAYARGIVFESEVGRVRAADNGQDTVTLFSPRTRRIKAALRKVPVLRVFPAFGKYGTVIFFLLIALILLEAFAPQLPVFEFNLPDAALWWIIAASVSVLALLAVLLRKRAHGILRHHGAEHMALNAYRAGKTLTTENITAEDRANENCGSLFVLMFFIVAVPFAFVPYGDYLLPLALGIAFELTLLSRRAKFLRPLLRFGLWTQRKIWTRQPEAAEIETARRGLSTLIEITERDKMVV